MRKKVLEKFDRNGDGKLDENERAAAKEAFKERFGEMRKKTLEKFDRNGDGKLDENKKEAAKEALKARRQDGPKGPGVKL
jgi:Ca2+-binding EF-hand superfamily protein